MSQHKQRREHQSRAFANFYLTGDKKTQRDETLSQNSSFAPIQVGKTASNSQESKRSKLWPHAPQTYHASGVCQTLQKREKIALASLSSTINHRTAEAQSQMWQRQSPRLDSPAGLSGRRPRTTERPHPPTASSGALTARAAAHLRARGPVHTFTGAEEKMLLFADHVPDEVNVGHSRRYEHHTHSTAIRVKPQLERNLEPPFPSPNQLQKSRFHPGSSSAMDASNQELASSGRTGGGNQIHSGSSYIGSSGKGDREPPSLPPNARKLLANLKLSLDSTNRGMNTSPEMDDTPPPPPQAVGGDHFPLDMGSPQVSQVMETTRPSSRPTDSAGSSRRKHTTDSGYTLDPESYKHKTPGEVLLERYKNAPFMPSDPEAHISFTQRKKYHKNSAPSYLSNGSELPASHQLKLTEKLVGDFKSRHDSLNALVKKYKYQDMADPEYDAFDDERNQLYAEINYTSNEGAIPARAFESNAEYILKLVDPSVGEAPDVKTIKRVMSRKASRFGSRHDME